MKSYKIGDVVRTKYPARSVLVTGRAEDIKEPGSGYTDKPGFEGILMSGPHKGQPTWGYDKEVGMVFPGSAKRAAEARQLESEYVGREKKRDKRARTVRKAKAVATNYPEVWLLGAVALGAILIWRRRTATPAVGSLPLPPF